MKALLATLALTLSATSFAATTNTEALKSIVEAGTFQGNNCSVTVSHSADSSSVSVTAQGTTEYFTIMNIASSTGYAVSYKAETNELSGMQQIRFPKYQYGGSKTFYAKLKADGKALVSISTILLDHRGNDASTYASCEISK